VAGRPSSSPSSSGEPLAAANTDGALFGLTPGKLAIGAAVLVAGYLALRGQRGKGAG
jgi:hypothetical protein